MGFSFGLLIFIAYMLTKCRFEVQEGYLAVLEEFGKTEFIDESKKQVKTYGPGLHFKKPWQTARKVSVMEQMLELSGAEGGLQPWLPMEPCCGLTLRSASLH